MSIPARFVQRLAPGFLRFLPLLVVALSASATAADRTPTPRILTSFLPVHSLVSAIAGSRAQVENWLPPGVDPHDFQFSPRDLRRLAEADLLVIGGLGLEGWKEEQLKSMSGNTRLRIVEAAAGVAEKDLIRDEGVNPHFWLDPLLMVDVARHIGRVLEEIDPEGAEIYRAKQSAYVERLQKLHEDYSRTLEPLKQVPFITAHNAFPYLARRYGLRLAGVLEEVAGGQVGAQRLATLSAMVEREGVRVLFTDGQPSRLDRRLARDLKLRIAQLETLETGRLAEGAYEEGMRRNLQSLQQALVSR